MSTPTPAKGLNFAILASAGTGKTYQLSVRIARLLMIGRKPQEIIALTFTRAAAAEFYLRALERLKEAATDPAKHLRICGVHTAEDPSPVDQGNPLVLDPAKFPQAAFAAKLRELVLTSDRLQLGTLDSFFVRLVNQFALELGLETSKPVTVPEQEAPALAQGAMQAMIAELEAGNLLDQLGAQLADYSDGKAAGNPTETLLGMVGSYHEFLTLAREAGKWGRPEAIWPGKDLPAWLNLDDKAGVDPNDVEIVLGRLDTYDADKPESKRREQLKGHFQRVAGAQRVSEIDSSDLQTFVERFGACLEEGRQELEVVYYAPKSVTLDAHEVGAARRVFQALISMAVRTAMRRTKALHACLTGFERAYDLQVRRKGLLSFADYVVLLNQWLAPLERREDIAAVLDDIHFRLDAKVSHWLLDEFQDTSTRQYDVLRRNIDEIIGQQAEDRSVFVVGDTKQSLYEWRAGNRELLNRVDAMIRETGMSAPMDETRRCSPQVLTMVNALLENLGGRDLGKFFSKEAAADWDKAFREQRAHAAAPRLGNSQWVRLTKPKAEEGSKDGAEKPDAEEQEADMAERHADYIAKDLLGTGLLVPAPEKTPRGLLPGVTCAVLVSKNSQARTIAERLRSQGVEATDEASVPVVRDNPLTAGLFALIEATAHPDNGLARGLAWMSPASRRLLENEKGAADWSKLTRRIADTFASRGAEAVVDWLAGTVDEAVAGDFLAKRLRQFRAVAADYDATGRRDLADFITYADGTHLRDMATVNSVQVITIHRSKGLEYGMVYMPCLNDSHHKMAEIRGNLLYMTPAMRQKTAAAAASGSIYDEALFRPDWILAGMNTALAEHVPALRESISALKAENAYGSLCRLYVGMTRAKHRLVMITDRLSDAKTKAGSKDHFEHPDNEGGHDFACFLESSLRKPTRGRAIASARAEGDMEPEVVWTDGAEPGYLGWTEAFTGKEAAKVEGSRQTAEGWGEFTAAVRPLRRKPSSHEPKAGAPWAKAGSELRGKHFGSYLHDLFARLDRDADAFLKDIGSMKAPEGQEEVHAQALERIRACLQDRAIRELLVGGLDGKLVWVERKAAIHQVMGDGQTAIVPAVFDRVHITPGKEALILDYKTATGRTDAYLKERYEEQMKAYRDAVARLTGIPIAAIHAKLVGIQPDRLSVVEVV